MNVSILCTDPRHPVNPRLQAWAQAMAGRAEVSLLRRADELQGGELLFLVSCHQIIGAPVRDRFRHTLVLHASALPQGRGMSPHVWQILAGARQITLTLLEAVDALDQGRIWHQTTLELDGTELHDQIHARLFDAELRLMDWAVAHLGRDLQVQPRPQQGEPSFYRRRTPEDSRVDPERPLAEAFDLLRVADPERYPAFFDYRGQRYTLRIERA